MWFGGQDPANFFNTIHELHIPITVYCNREWMSSVLIKSRGHRFKARKIKILAISVLSVLIKINLSTEEHTKNPDSRRVITVMQAGT